MHSRYIPVLLFFFVALFVSVGLGQEKSFPIGVFLSGGEDFTRYRNYHQVKEMGVNMVVQHAEKGSGGKGNLDSLAQFDYVIAWNGDREDLIHH
ncbi:MAG: hypothetical protein EHM47_00345, partial [Ignavibacteriales bacterium]